MFSKIHLINHGLNQSDVSKVFHYKNGKLSAITSEEMSKKYYGDWTLIANVIDADNFECWSGEIDILNLAVFSTMDLTHKAYNKMTEQELKELALFDCVELSEFKKSVMSSLRAHGKELAVIIMRSCPASADRSAAIRSLRLAIMQANASIVHDRV